MHGAGVAVMAQDQPQRSKAERIERLRQRLQAAYGFSDRKITDVIKGILDLLADEL